MGAEMGARFGRLTVVGSAEPVRKPSGRLAQRVVVRCECGSPERIVLSDNLGRSSTSCGCSRKAPRPARRSDVVAYTSAHTRVNRSRGKASAQACVDCADGGPAAHWSYDHTGVDEHTEVVDGRTVAYSTDVEQYSPRCVAHHVEFDRHERTACRRGHPLSERGPDGSCYPCRRLRRRERIAAQATPEGAQSPCPSPSPTSC